MTKAQSTEFKSQKWIVLTGIGLILSVWLFFVITFTHVRVYVPSHAAQLNCNLTTPNLNLTNWKLTLPTGSGTNAPQITQPQLKTYINSPYFVPSSDCTSIVFQAPTSGSTTGGSSYPRSELREMTNSGASEAKWSNQQGTHTMESTHAILALPQGKKEIVVAQVHNTSFDAVVIRLNTKRLFIKMDGNTSGPNTFDLDTNYTLGTTFSIKFVARGGKVEVYYNNSAAPVFTYTRNLSTAFFKAGAYIQSNCSTESAKGYQCGENNYGKAALYKLIVTHTGTTSPTPTRTPTPRVLTPTPTRIPTATPTSSSTSFNIWSQVQIGSSQGQYGQSSTNCVGFPTMSDANGSVNIEFDVPDDPGNIAYRYYTNCDSAAGGRPYAAVYNSPQGEKRVWIDLPSGYTCGSWEIYRTTTVSSTGTLLVSGTGCTIDRYNFTLQPGFNYSIKYIVSKV